MVAAAACFPGQRSVTFPDPNARVPGPVLSLGQGSGMVSNPEWQVLPPADMGKAECHILQIEVERQL